MSTKLSLVPHVKAEELREFITSQVLQDPGLPRPRPTESFWQQPAHPIVATIQSPRLPQKTDIAVIGSGITGCSVTDTLLKSGLLGSPHVTVLEARTLCSGATGRNGGQLATAAGMEFAENAAKYGETKAAEIARFSVMNIDALMKLAPELPEHIRGRAEIRKVQGIGVISDVATLEYLRSSIVAFEQALPEYKGRFYTVDKSVLIEEFGLKGGVGGVACHGIGTMWPYRFITDMFEDLLSRYPERLSIEANTPVLSVSEAEDDEGYIIVTPRGTIKARKVVYATNAYTAHLIPALRGKLFPTHGHMSTQHSSQLSPASNIRARSWGYMTPPAFDQKTRVIDGGLFYLQQNLRSGDIWVGCDTVRLDEYLDADDTKVDSSAREALEGCLPRIFSALDQGPAPVIKAMWSGIQGYTADGMPLVGRLPDSLQEGGQQKPAHVPSEQWIAAGYNGYGMDKCWLTGRVLVQMMAGHAPPSWFPSLYQISEERLLNDLRVGNVATKYAELQNSIMI